MSMELETGFGQIPLYKYQQSPLSEMSGVEILDNVQVGSRKVGSALYKRVRELLIQQDFAILGVMGMSGAAKGAFSGNIAAAANQDAYLSTIISSKGKSLEIMNVLFAQALHATRTPSFRRDHPCLATDPNILLGRHVPEDYAKFSRTMFVVTKQLQEAYLKPEETEHGFIYVNKNDKSILVNLETSAHTSAPIPPVISAPVPFIGVDRGNTVLYDLAVDNVLAPFTTIVALKRADKLRDWIIDHRSKYVDRNLSPHEVFSEVIHTFTDKNGNVINALQLSPKEQRELLDFLASYTGPPAAIARSDREFYNSDPDNGGIGLVNKLHERFKDTAYELSSPSAHGFLDYLGKVLDKKIHEVRNDFFQGDKTYHLDHYFINSLIASMYPEILPRFVKDLMPKEMFERGQMIKGMPTEQRWYFINQIA